MARLLVIDDEPDISLGVRLLLERAGHAVRVSGDGLAGLRTFFADPADLVLLDVMMPRLDGWETLSRLRDVSDVPVLMLTARGLDVEKARGLRAGADDYLTKPFSKIELLARVDALLRRAPREGPTVHEAYADGRLTLDFARREATVDGEPVQLTALEFRLLGVLVTNADRVLTHMQLLELVWREPGDGSRDRLKTSVRTLRSKLGWSGDGSGPLAAVRGVGYRYHPQ